MTGSRHAAENVFLAAGSNTGDRLKHLQSALDFVAMLDSTRIISVASVYETSPLGTAATNSFLNTALQIETFLSPEALLKNIQTIEAEVGRKKTERWADREIDLDIILFGNLVVNNPGLVIPHPECVARDFVLAPLVEIAPLLVHPVLQIAFSELLEHVQDKYILGIVKEKLFINYSPGFQHP